MAAAKTIARSELPNGVTVSTVRTGREYETSFILRGRVSDPFHAPTRAWALVVHDSACDWINYPSRREPNSVRSVSFSRMLADIAAA